MEDLLKMQIHENCRLALPEGLNDLMSDISREVLREQPKNLLQFITDYLSALLVSRENLATANRICENICNNLQAANLEDELRYKGIDQENIDIVKSLVESYFMKHAHGKTVKEGYLVAKIMRKTSVPYEQIADIQEAVRKAFVRHQAYNTTQYEMTPDESLDDVSRAAHHTLGLYRKTKPTDDEFLRTAEKIEAAYRAYGVRRQKACESVRSDWSYSTAVKSRADDIESDITEFSKHIHFGSESEHEDEEHVETTSVVVDNASQKTDDSVFVHPPKMLRTVSSTSLAGSYLHLPKFRPYSVHDASIKETDEERINAEHLDVDYTKETSKEIVFDEVVIPPKIYTAYDSASSVEDETHEIYDRKEVSEVTVGDDELINEPLDAVSDDVEDDDYDDDFIQEEIRKEPTDVEDEAADVDRDDEEDDDVDRDDEDEDDVDRNDEAEDVGRN